MRRRTSLIIGVVMLLVAAGTTVGWRWWHHRAPYEPDALGATATLQMVDQATADAAMAPLSPEHATAEGDQIFLGRVAWLRPPGITDDGSLRIVILDKRTHRMPGFVSVTSPRPDDVGAGSDNTLDIAQKRYPWLQGIGTREINGSFWNTSSAITASIDARPVTFVIVLHPTRPDTPPEQAVANAPATVSDLLIALITIGPDGQVYWAQRLLH